MVNPHDLSSSRDASGAGGSPSRDPALESAEALARWMDDRWLDPLLGLVLPGAGDVIGAVLGVYPVLLAWRRGAPKPLIARMLLNLAVDVAGGAVPILGDVWDFLFRAHRRNLALLRERTADRAVRSRPADTLVVAGAGLALLAALALPVLAVIALVRALVG